MYANIDTGCIILLGLEQVDAHYLSWKEAVTLKTIDIAFMSNIKAITKF